MEIPQQHSRGREVKTMAKWGSISLADRQLCGPCRFNLKNGLGKCEEAPVTQNPAYSVRDAGSEAFHCIV